MWQKKQTVEREEEKISETRKLSFNPHSTQQLVHVITLLHFLVLKVNIDKPIILLPSFSLVVLQRPSVKSKRARYKLDYFVK